MGICQFNLCLENAVEVPEVPSYALNQRKVHLKKPVLPFTHPSYAMLPCRAPYGQYTTTMRQNRGPRGCTNHASQQLSNHDRNCSYHDSELFFSLRKNNNHDKLKKRILASLKQGCLLLLFPSFFLLPSSFFPSSNNGRLIQRTCVLHFWDQTNAKHTFFGTAVH